MTESKDRAAEISARLAEIAPYQQEGEVTARGIARYLASTAQIAYARTASHVTLNDLSLVAARFAAAHALMALADVDGDRADLAARQIRDAWEDGGGTGEWIWEHLAPDSEEAAALTEELAKLRAAAEPVTVTGTGPIPPLPGYVTVSAHSLDSVLSTWCHTAASDAFPSDAACDARAELVLAVAEDAARRDPAALRKTRMVVVDEPGRVPDEHGRLVPGNVGVTSKEEPVPSLADALRASLAPTVPGSGPEVPGE